VCVVQKAIFAKEVFTYLTLFLNSFGIWTSPGLLNLKLKLFLKNLKSSKSYHSFFEISSSHNRAFFLKYIFFWAFQKRFLGLKTAFSIVLSLSLSLSCVLDAIGD